jgi:hypothetical protein
VAAFVVDGPVPEEKTAASEPLVKRAFAFLLITISLLSAVPRIALGMSQFIQYDGFWHLFIATQDRWSQFYLEWSRDAHPPLYYLLLRAVASLGHSHLLYRLPSIIPGIAGVYLLGRIAGRVFENKWIALLAATAFAFSISYIDLTIDLRGYPLALCFILCAFDQFLHFCCYGTSMLAFGILTGLAISAEYFSILFFLACTIAALIYALRAPDFRSIALRAVRAHPAKAVAAPAIPTLVTAVLFVIHINTHQIPQNNVLEFYWDQQSSAVLFVLAQLRNELNYFLPVEFGEPAAFLAFCVGAVGVVAFVILRSRKTEGLVTTIPALMLVLLLSELIVFALLRLYPFGGLVRQQSIIFPFLLMTGFGMLDWVLTKIPVRAVRSAILLLTAGCIAWSSTYNWGIPWRSVVELRTTEYENFRRVAPGPEAVLTDQYSLIAFYTHVHKWKWRLHSSFSVPEPMQTYEVRKDGQKFTVLRDVNAWNFDLTDPAFYATVSASMRAASLTSVDLFLLKQLPVKTDVNGLEHQKQAIRSLAANAGLLADVRFYNAGEAYVHFSAK